MNEDDNRCPICNAWLAFIAEEIATCRHCRVSWRWPFRLREEE